MTLYLRTARRFAVGALALGAVVTLAPAAAASDTYPGAVQSALNMPCAPTCTVCHATLEGGLGTVVKPFGMAILGTADLTVRAPDSIPAALTLMEGPTCIRGRGGPMEQGPCDSDRDGMSDVAELKEGRDPNVEGPGGLCGPRYGCGARVARGTSDVDWVSLLIAGAAAAALVRRARRSKKSS